MYGKKGGMCVAAYAQHVFFLFSFFLVVVKGIIIITAWHAAVSSLKRLWLVAFLKKKKNLFTITCQDVILMVCKGGIPKSHLMHRLIYYYYIYTIIKKQVHLLLIYIF